MRVWWLAGRAVQEEPKLTDMQDNHPYTGPALKAYRLSELALAPQIQGHAVSPATPDGAIRRSHVPARLTLVNSA
jgi:hypothetical protein